MMKICIYSPTANFLTGGGENYSLNQAGFLLKGSRDIHFVVLKQNTDNQRFREFKKKYPDIKVHYIESAFSGCIPFDQLDMTNHDNIYRLYFSLARSFADLCLREKFDLVISHYSLASLFIPRSIRNILILHGVPSKKDVINEVAVGAADVLLAVSYSVADGWKNMYGKNLKIKIIHNAVDSEFFFPFDIKEDIDLFFVGRIIEIKGVQTLLKAISKVKKRKQVVLKNVVIAGNGPFASNLKIEMIKLGLDKIVKFIGGIEDCDLNSYYNRSKICIFPSYAKEGVLTTMLEAAAAGRAIITANCCGMIDFIRDKNNGLLFKPKDSSDLAKKIESILDKSDLRKNLGKNARRDILKYWTWKKNAIRMEKYL